MKIFENLLCEQSANSKEKKLTKYLVNYNGRMKRCRVCNDLAFGYNFNGLTCESCKAFFRRHAHRIDKLTCHNQNRCSIDIENRRFCKRCRLQKCFDIGMDKDLLLNRRRKSSQEVVEIVATISPQPSPFSLDDEYWLFKSPPRIKSIPTQIATSTTDSLKPSTQVAFEQSCLEIVKKLPQLFLESPTFTPKLVGHAADLLPVINCQQYFIQGIIQFSQFLTPFKHLNQADQLVILKQSFPELMMLRSGFYFNFEKDAFMCRLTHDCSEVFYVDLAFLYGTTNCDQLIDQHRKVALILREELQFDTVIRDLLLLLIMFKPKDKVSCPEYLRYNFIKYCHLLQNYLEVIENDQMRAERKYRRLIRIIDMLTPLTAVYREIFRRMNRANRLAISQTLTEIYEI